MASSLCAPARTPTVSPVLSPLSPPSAFAAPPVLPASYRPASTAARVGGARPPALPTRGVLRQQAAAASAAVASPRAHAAGAPPPGRRVPRQVLETAASAATPSTALRPFAYTFFVTCARGLGETLATEVSAPTIGGNVLGVYPSGVRFGSDSLAAGYAAVLWARTAIRVLVEVGPPLDVSRYRGRRSDLVYEWVRDGLMARDMGNGRGGGVIGDGWASLVPRGSTFAVDVRVGGVAGASDGGARLTRAIGLAVKDAVCDALVGSGAPKPERPDSYAVADVPLFVAASGAEVTLYRDLVGGSLHKRGYRAGGGVMHRAALNETVAAGICYAAGFSVEGEWAPPAGVISPLALRDGVVGTPPPAPPAWRAGAPLAVVDPMCGSGTLLIEAGLLARRVPPGLLRPAGALAHPFTRWPDYPSGAWSDLQSAAAAAVRPASACGVCLYGNDVHSGALSLALAGLSAARLDQMVVLNQGNAATYTPPGGVGVVLCNPPWGRRLTRGDTDTLVYPRVADGSGGGGGDDDIQEVDPWVSLGMFLRRQARGVTATLLSGDPNATYGLRMRAAVKRPVRIGNVSCRIVQYAVLPPRVRRNNGVGDRLDLRGRRVD
ncbi:hypothetical protein MMPV_006699 [Pyropia vietnamensis]